MVKWLTAKLAHFYNEKMAQSRFLFALASVFVLLGGPAVARFEDLDAGPAGRYSSTMFGIVIAVGVILILANRFGQKTKGAAKQGLSFAPTHSQLEKAADQLCLSWGPPAASKAVSCLTLVIFFPFMLMIPFGVAIMVSRDFVLGWLLFAVGMIVFVPFTSAFSIVFIPKIWHRVTFDRVAKSVTYSRERGSSTIFHEATGSDFSLRVQSYYDQNLESMPPKYAVVLTFENGREMVLDCFPSESEAQSLLDELEAFAAGLRSS